MIDEPESRKWRDRAERYRVLALACSSQGAREAYWRIVQHCMDLADQLDETAARRRATPSDDAA